MVMLSIATEYKIIRAGENESLREKSSDQKFTYYLSGQRQGGNE
jgi:hypothetical protein